MIKYGTFQYNIIHTCHLLFCILEVSLVLMPTASLIVTDSVHPELGASSYEQVLLSQFTSKSTGELPPQLMVYTVRLLDHHSP